MTAPPRVSIGGVSIAISGANDDRDRALVPHGYLRRDALGHCARGAVAEPQATLRHLRWLMQKEQLGQDVFLTGPAGTRAARLALALKYCELTGRELEYVALSRDTTEADLTQRRELRGKTAVYHDQGAVRAALRGRVLVLDGIEKVERNVMPVLNNLLENREITLADGRFLMHPRRYDELFGNSSDGRSSNEPPATQQQQQIARVSERFWVIALGLPVPRYPGNPLDPPLRSRFQGRRVDPAPRRGLLSAIREEWAPTLPDGIAQTLCQLSRGIYTLGQQAGDESGQDGAKVAFSELMYLGDAGVLSSARLLEVFPQLSVQAAVDRVYPRAALYTLTQIESRDMISGMLTAAGSLDDGSVSDYRVASALVSDDHSVSSTSVALEFVPLSGGETVTLTVPGGAAEPVLPAVDDGTMQDHHWSLLTSMLQSHCIGNDVLIVGERGSGKTFIGQQFASALGYAPVETLFIYKDMTSRDLLQRRTTGSEKETLWQPTPLAIAVRTGRLAILDGINRLPPGTISALLRLIEDREVRAMCFLHQLTNAHADC